MTIKHDPIGFMRPDMAIRVPVDSAASHINVGLWQHGKNAAIFLHGFGEGSYVWDGLAPAICGAHCAVAIDFRGHGASSRSHGSGYSIAQHAVDVKAVIDALQLEKFVLVGHSMGGGVALRVAAENAAQFAGLALVDHSPKREVPGHVHIIQEFKESPQSFADKDAFMKWMRAGRPLASIARLRHYADHALHQTADGQYALKRDPEMTIVDDGKHIFDILKRVREPLLIIRGAGSSVLTQEDADMMQKCANQSELITVPVSGHGIMAENPSFLTQALRDFYIRCMR